MTIYNSTDSNMQLGVSDNPVIKPGESYKYTPNVFDTIPIQLGVRQCRITREYSDIAVDRQFGLDAEVTGEDDPEIVVKSMPIKAVVLVSGGLDSAVTLADAVSKYGSDNVVAANITYGQVHVRETECAEAIADHFGVKLIQEDISSVFEYAKNVCSLMQGSQISMNDKSYSEQIAEEGSPNTEVPLRNGIFLMSAASLAMSIFPKEYVVVSYGAHSDDAAGSAYPDCSPAFASAIEEAICIGSRGMLHIERPLIELSKAGVVTLGLKLKVPFHLTTSCYHGGDKACGVCGTCRDRIAAFQANQVIDPIPYADSIDWTGCSKIDYLEDKYV